MNDGIQLEQLIAAAVFVGARVAGLMIFCPFLGSAVIPVRLKAVITLLLTLLMFPLHGPIQLNVDLWHWAGLALFEAVIGIVLGLAANFMLEAAILAGQILGVQMGYSLATLFDPQTKADTPVLAEFHRLAALLIFLRLDVHHWLLRALARSFSYLPASSGPLNLAVTEGLLRAAGGILLAGVQIAAPGLIATLVTDVALGFLGKASPQLPVLFVGQSLPVWRNELGIFRGLGLAASVSWLVAALGGIAQGGLVFAPSALAPDLNRFNPASRMEQLFSPQAVSRLLKSLLPTAALVYLTAQLLVRDWARLPSLLHGSGYVIVTFVAKEIFELVWKSSLVLLVWAAADYLFEHWRHESQLRMSRQDLRDEFKETEGNPAVKMRIRRLQRQARRKRMLKDVERAAVVITNPTSFAIALVFNMQMDAPIVVAKGRDLLAQQIREVALWHGVPLVENPPLAHALYRAVEVGQAIPPKLYAVIAEILAAIWRAQERATQGSRA